MEITGAIFDMDGTLIDSLMVWDVFWKRMGEDYLGGKHFRPDEDIEKAMRTLPLTQGMELLHQTYGIGESGLELTRYADDITIQFYIHDMCMKDGALEYLEYLFQKGVRMCIASAGSRHLLNIAVEKFGLGKYFFQAFFPVPKSAEGRNTPTFI